MTTLTNTYFRTGTRPLGLRGLIWSALSVQKQRKSLAKLDDRTLCDLGITREQARQEATRPLWDVPVTWRKPQGC